MSLVLNLSPKSSKVIKKLIGIDAAAVQELASVLTENLERLGQPSDAHELARTFKELDQADAFEFLNFLAPICISRLSTSKDYKELLEALLDASTRTDGLEELSSVEKRRLKDVLKTVFSNTTIALKSKAVRLQSIHDRTFNEVEILSDVRPVFSVNGKASIEAVVTFQTLRIEYYSDHALKTFSCALDAKDLQQLKVAIDRAEKKQKAIYSMLEQSSVPVLKVNE